MFSSSAYRWTVAIEVILLFGGGAVLNAIDEGAYSLP
jgi:hypothetical protein